MRRGLWLSIVSAAGLIVAASAVADPLVVTVTSIRKTLRSYCADCGVHSSPSVIGDTPASIARRARLREKLFKTAATMTPDEVYAQGRALLDRPGSVEDRQLAIEVMEMAADRGSAEARKALVGIGARVYSDYWNEQAANTETPERWGQRGVGYDRPTDTLSQAHRLGWSIMAAETGDGPAQYWLGDHYAASTDHHADPLADYWFKRAADNGYSFALMRLAVLYNTPGSELYATHTAIAWYAKAADARVDGAAGRLCLWPEGDVEVRRGALSRCLDLFNRGASLDDASRSALAIALYKGDPLPRDEAMAWASLNTGTPVSPYYRGRMLIDGRVVPADPETGCILIAYAASRGDIEAVAWMKDHPAAESGDSGELDLNHLTGLTALAVSGPGMAGAPAPAGELAAGIGAMAADYYPSRAQDDEVEGIVLVRCRWTAEGLLSNCTVIEDTPKGYGFGAASAKLLPRLLILGTPAKAWLDMTAGKWSVFEIHWTLQ